MKNYLQKKGSEMDLDQVPSLWRIKPVQFESSESGDLFKMHLIVEMGASPEEKLINLENYVYKKLVFQTYLAFKQPRRRTVHQANKKS